MVKGILYFMKKNIHNKPTIGITMDYEENKTYSKFPWYALRQNYCSAISKMNAIPIPLPHENTLIPDMLSLIDGLVISGGAFDIDPSYFSETTKYKNIVTKKKRTDFELDVTLQALQLNIPILGICGGEQLLNVIYGGSLFQDIAKDLPKSLNHEQTNPRDQTSHEVTIVPNTLLENIVKKRKINVNSAHHQSVNRLGNGLKVCAMANDGIIEGIEDNEKHFCLGIQWHPEFLITSSDKNILKRFIKAARDHKNV